MALIFSEEIKATKEKDPAAKGHVQIIFLYSGLHAIMIHRLTHGLWQWKLLFLARWLSQVGRFLTGIEIHPGAQIGQGLFIDHGMGVVIGETAIVGNNVTLFQGVTLGGTGKETGKRHPTLGDNVVVGAGAKVLGNIHIGANSYIGANAVVLKDVPPNSTVVGVPGHITKQEGKKIDLMMDHAHVSDPMMQHMKDLIRRIKTLEDKLKEKE
ncbi:MAG TPA: serine O-acetyltransferase [Candidatus Omnitrophica bacterium]|nr:MAG: serine O-acetyltransferase [Omnitrophica WOR_2 bacterium GWA2_45_18]HBR14902.1 serine O-acetyltransferase [Candidatus Omnitrophota bacterium]